jgi:hypothetical protein
MVAMRHDHEVVFNDLAGDIFTSQEFCKLFSFTDHQKFEFEMDITRKASG